jgi:DNA-binding MarR family transcriptional regulator
MADVTKDTDLEKTRIMLGLLESVERDGAKTQRRLAAELGIALGLVNAYLKRCVKKGLLKVREAPARRYAYYLTPRGFAEKSRLTIEYLAVSLSFFRRARLDCADVLTKIAAQGHSQVVLAGVSDLAEIARLCALECGIEIAAVVCSDAAVASFAGLSVMRSFDAIPDSIDAIVVTDLISAQETYEAAVGRFGCERVWVPDLLGLRPSNSVRVAS